MKKLNIDIETFSSVDIKNSGLYAYAEAPDFTILLFAYSVDGQPVKIIDLAQGEEIPSEIISALQDQNVEKRAYNAAFEWYCLNSYGVKTPVNQWRCTMAQGMYAGYPAGLGAIGAALKLPGDKKKLATGRSLIKTFCVPRKPTKTDSRERILPHHEPEKWELFKEYCKQDVVTEMAVAKKLENFQLPPFEQELWVLDVLTNSRGINVDKDLISNAINMAATINAEQIEEAKDLSGLDNPNSVSQFKKYLEGELNTELDSLDKGVVANLLTEVTDEKITRLLELKQEFSKTSIKKYEAMERAECSDGRVRGVMQYYGARTGRWAGKLVQVQNLPRNYLETLNLARETVIKGDIDFLRLIYSNIPDTLSQLIRTAFIPSDGHTFLIADYSAIEARVIAWLAGEQWRLKVFADGKDIYCSSASQMFGVPVEKHGVNGHLRQKGKIAELALGYGGSVGALKAMGALDMGLSEEELPDMVARWRGSNKAIVGLWYAIENAALEVLHTGKPQYMQYGISMAREVDFINGLDYLTIQLPSTRKLYYPNPHLGTNRFGSESIMYMGIDQTSKKWAKLETYGGKLTENIIQAIARDCLARTLRRLEEKGYRVAMHIHDEVVVDAPIGTPLEAITDLMAEPIPWAPGLLLKGDGFESSYYKKD